MKSIRFLLILGGLLLLIMGVLLLPWHEENNKAIDPHETSKEETILKPIQYMMNDYLSQKADDQYQVYYEEALDDNYYIVGIKEQSGRLLNYQYYLVDHKKSEVVNVGFFDLLVDYIDYQYPEIIFESKHINSVTPFRYPKKKYVYNINSKVMDEQPWIYAVGKQYQSINIGNGHNKTKLEEISFKENRLKFYFNQHEESILAGGLFTPNIEVLSVKENTLTLGLEGVYYEKNVITALGRNENVLGVKVNDRQKINGNNETVLTITLAEDIGYFYLNLVANENGYMDLIIEFLKADYKNK